MAEAAKSRVTYDDLFKIPENMTGEIIDGELIVTPRPSRHHVYASSALGSELGPPPLPPPRTMRVDKIRKMPIYARNGVGRFWLIDPIAESLDVFRLESGKWTVAGFYSEDDKARPEPFQEIEIDLNNLWLE